MKKDMRRFRVEFEYEVQYDPVNGFGRVKDEKDYIKGVVDGVDVKMKGLKVKRVDGANAPHGRIK